MPVLEQIWLQLGRVGEFEGCGVGVTRNKMHDDKILQRSIRGKHMVLTAPLPFDIV